MIRFLDILKNVVLEGKRYQFDPEVYLKLHAIVDELWSKRNQKFTKKTLVTQLPFKTADGVDGLVKILINPRLKYIGEMGVRPNKSLDPADIYIELNPKHYQSKKNLYLTLYHEMIHASDPTQSHKWTPSYDLTYDEESDEKYWGHPVEFFAITNEFLEGLFLEFERRIKSSRTKKDAINLQKSFQNILNYFAKGEKLSKLSWDVLSRVNDENVDEDRISKLVADIKSQNPEFFYSRPLKNEEDLPYYLYYVQMIKKFNPKIWSRFLTMLYKLKEEIDFIMK